MDRTGVGEDTGQREGPCPAGGSEGWHGPSGRQHDSFIKSDTYGYHGPRTLPSRRCPDKYTDVPVRPARDCLQRCGHSRPTPEAARVSVPERVAG